MTALSGVLAYLISMTFGQNITVMFQETQSTRPHTAEKALWFECVELCCTEYTLAVKFSKTLILGLTALINVARSLTLDFMGVKLDTVLDTFENPTFGSL